MSAVLRGMVGIACLLVVTRVAVAEDKPAAPPPEAKKAFADGKVAFERGDYETALQLFQRAMLIAPAPSLYYNIGSTMERLGRYEDSALAFERYLASIGAPTNDEEREFQKNVKTRAEANHERARTPEPTPPPRVEPSALPAQPTRYPYYAYNPYVPAAPPPPLTHRQKLDAARRHRNNGIALLAVGGVLLVAGSVLTGLVAGTSWVDRDAGLLTHGNYGAAMWGATFPLIVGVTLVIPGAVATAKWQREYTAENKRPDEQASSGIPLGFTF
jgi:hypothetical protein